MINLAKKEKIDYEKIVESEVLVLKTGNSIRVKFLDNGYLDTTEIIDKTTNEIKTIDKYTYSVLDLSDNKQKEFSSLGTRFILRIKPFLPIPNKSFNIRKFQFGLTKFDIDYEITPI